MTRSRTRRSIGAALALAAAVALAGSVPAGAGEPRVVDPARATVHCSLTVLDQKSSGELVTGPLRCDDERGTSAGASTAGGVALASVIAIHYADVNFGGSTLSIQGGGCTGGWLNLPAGWVNVVSSTWSVCTSQHFDLFNLGGAGESLAPFGGNLSALHDRTNSVRYT